MDRVSRTAGSSSTTKISPRVADLSVMCHRPSTGMTFIRERHHARCGVDLVRICTGPILNAQVARATLKTPQGSRCERVPAMQNAADYTSVRPGDLNDNYTAIVSNLRSLA